MAGTERRGGAVGGTACCAPTESGCGKTREDASGTNGNSETGDGLQLRSGSTSARWSCESRAFFEWTTPVIRSRALTCIAVANSKKRLNEVIDHNLRPGQLEGTVERSSRPS